MVTGIKEEVCIVVLAWIGEVVKLQKRSGEYTSTRMASMQQPTSIFLPERLPESMPGNPEAEPVLCAASHRARRRTEQPLASRRWMAEVGMVNERCKHEDQGRAKTRGDNGTFGALNSKLGS
jgi:hypothetical protein